MLSVASFWAQKTHGLPRPSRRLQWWQCLRLIWYHLLCTNWDIMAKGSVLNYLDMMVKESLANLLCDLDTPKSASRVIYRFSVLRVSRRTCYMPTSNTHTIWYVCIWHLSFGGMIDKADSVIAGGRDGTIPIWDIRKTPVQPTVIVTHHSGPVTGLSVGGGMGLSKYVGDTFSWLSVLKQSYKL